jgi:GNAT superfamily N-acetyltransferase
MQVLEAKKERDLDTIIQYQLNLAFETEGLKLDKEIVSAGVSSVFDDPSKGKYFMAKKDGKTIASLLTMPEWSDWRNSAVMWIHSVYVLPENRAQGVFKEMYAFLKGRVQQSDDLAGLRLYVDKSNTNAQKVYQKIGMSNQHYDLFEWLK